MALIQAFTNDPRCLCWPFWVLEINPAATSGDIEKAARDITAKIQFNIPGAGFFLTPMGNITRDEFVVREAKAVLQDPARRLMAEFWYVNPENENNKDESGLSKTVPYWLNQLQVEL